MVCLGLGLALAMTYPFDVVKDSDATIDMLCYVLFAIPIGLAIFQTILMYCFYNHDTPKVMKEKGQEE